MSQGYPYKFSFYASYNAVLTGDVYVLAKNFQDAQELIKKMFPYHMVLSYVKCTDKPMDSTEFQDFVAEYSGDN